MKLTIEIKLSDDREAYYPDKEAMLNDIIPPQDGVSYKIVESDKTNREEIEEVMK